MTSRFARLVAPLAVGIALAACTAGSSTTTSATSGDSVKVGLILEPANYDFTTQSGAAIPQIMMTNVYESLVKVDDSGKYVPGLATSWTLSPDRKTYTFDLVDNATFSNGKTFTADDAVFSINYVKTKWTNGLKKAMDVVASAQALSPTKLAVNLTQPSNDWLFRMTTHVGAMMTPDGVADLANKPVGTGPYTVESRVMGDSITLARNDRYWATKPFFSKVVVRYIADPTALNNALLTGAVNAALIQAPESLGQFTANPKYTVIQGTSAGEVLMAFNNSEAIFQDKRVRQAIRQGIDHKALMDTCWAGKGTLIGSFVPPTDPWYEDLTGVLPYDKAGATALLAQAGKAGTTLRLRIPNLPYAVSCGQVVKSQLEAVGFRVDLTSLQFQDWLKQVFTGGDFDLSIVAHVEPRDMRAVFGDPTYYTKYTNPALTAALAAADSGTETEYVDNMRTAARILADDVAGDFLFLLPNLMASDANLVGLPKNAITTSLDMSRLARTS
ncbi:MAG: ABC transporter substrate-binding protein [Dermatophilaceae bacterium]